jgi:hypothetical protein
MRSTTDLGRHMHLHNGFSCGGVSPKRRNVPEIEKYVWYIWYRESTVASGPGVRPEPSTKPPLHVDFGAGERRNVTQTFKLFHEHLHREI